MEYISKSEKDTFDFAKKIAGTLVPGDVVALVGNLGAGKTTFTKGLGAALGVREDITSPTFVIMKQYRLNNGKKLSNNHFLIHIDCYRIHTREDAESVGLLDLLCNNKDYIVIEWPENIENILPKNIKRIYIKYLNDSKRIFKTG